MKQFILTVFCLLVLAPVAFAATVVGQVPINGTTAASGTVTTSSTYFVNGYKTKSMSVTGLTGSTFKNMSGTVVAQCAPTSSGPWSTCIANDYAQTAISRTTNGIFTWADAFPYVRFQWTAGTVSTTLKAWFYYSE